jgi:nitrogen fixation protein NifZ
MIAEIQPRYEWGQRVRAADALLVSEGDAGEIVQLGKQIDTGAAVYMVEFATDMVVGCFELELVPVNLRGDAQ